MSSFNTPRYWSRGPLQTLGACPACGSRANPRAVMTRQDNDSALPDMWRQVHCASCASIYLDPRPTPESIHLAYADYYTHAASEDLAAGDASRRSSVAWRLVNGYLNQRFSLDLFPASRLGPAALRLFPLLRRRLETFGRHIPRELLGSQAHLLDVGCGNGSFMRLAVRMGLDPVGIEPDEKAAEVCRAQGLRVIGGDIYSATLLPSAFDIITLGHVIEHVDEPVKFLRRLNDLLKPGGLLWLSTPNPESLTHQFFQASWIHLHPPFHVLIPSRRQLKSWLETATFEKISEVARGSDSPGMWRESLRLCLRENARPPRAATLTRLLHNLLLMFRPHLCEETVVMARKTSSGP